MLTDSQIAELRELCEKATEGPWAWDSRGQKDKDIQVGIAVGSDDNPIEGFVEEDDDVIYVDSICMEVATTDDAAFIAAARTALPEALKMIDELVKKLEEIRDFDYDQPDRIMIADGMREIAEQALAEVQHG